jgi:hypothetical protein
VPMSTKPEDLEVSVHVHGPVAEPSTERLKIVKFFRAVYGETTPEPYIGFMEPC